jgi:hypothetical protein
VTVKVEMERSANGKKIALAFECSRAEEHEIVDAIRVAMMGNHHKEGGYIHSNRWVVHIEEGSTHE